jgi:hypothetical protein
MFDGEIAEQHLVGMDDGSGHQLYSSPFMSRQSPAGIADDDDNDAEVIDTLHGGGTRQLAPAAGSPVSICIDLEDVRALRIHMAREARRRQRQKAEDEAEQRSVPAGSRKSPASVAARQQLNLAEAAAVRASISALLAASYVVDLAGLL